MATSSIGLATPRPGLVVTPPVRMLALALAWSWLWWGAAIALGGLETAGGGLAWLAGGFGPTVAVVITLRRSTAEYRASFRQRLFKGRVAIVFWVAAALFATGPKLVGLAIAALGGHAASGEAITLAELPFTLVFSLVAVSIEEPLWRGVVLDAMRPQLAKASLVIGLVWSAWHIPLFAVDGTFQGDLGLLTADFWIFLVGVVGLSVFLT